MQFRLLENEKLDNSSSSWSWISSTGTSGNLRGLRILSEWNFDYAESYTNTYLQSHTLADYEVDTDNVIWSPDSYAALFDSFIFEERETNPSKRLLEEKGDELQEAEILTKTKCWWRGYLIDTLGWELTERSVGFTLVLIWSFLS